MTADPERTLNMAVQVVPMDGNVFEIVDHAIQAIATSGVTYEVGPMETVMEGELDALLNAAKAAHLACFEAGAKGVMTYIKIGDHIHGTTIAEKVTKYRVQEEG
jgi:uncharacterized protein YqgV (UPF0045/DUF77 family)